MRDFREPVRKGRSAGFPHAIGTLADSPATPLAGECTRQRTTGGLSMDTMLEDTRQTVKTQLSKLRWAIGMNGALSVALGVVIIVWPGISLYSLVIVFGAYALARGILGLVMAIANSDMDGRGWLVASSLAGIAVGVIVFADTGMSALALLYVIGAYAIVLGIAAVSAAFVLPLSGGDSALLGLTGVLSVAFGIVMFAKPGDGALAVLALIAAYAIIIGLSELIVAIGGKRAFGISDDRYAPASA
jgi:uncharacterized membrane protein HdeD (DUF308 family)